MSPCFYLISARIISSDDSVELCWEVDGADKNIVSGSWQSWKLMAGKKIRLKKNTILRIGASNERQSKIKAS